MRSLAAVVLTLLAATCATAATATAATPAQTLAAALAAARAQHSVHYVATQTAATGGVTMVGDAAADRGVQHITFRKGGKTGHVTVIVVANTAYVRGDAFTLHNYMGLPASSASAYAGKWFRLSHTTQAFATVAAGVRLSSTISELAMPKPVTAVASTTVAGHRVVGVRGTTTQAGQVITQTLYIAATGTPLPVEQLGTSGAVKVRVLFSRWNESVSLAAPAGSVALR